MINQYPKRLIEVDLPIKRISAHARREKSIRHGHISTLHIWWARRPLAACRAVTCAALWIDPADPLCPQEFRDKAMLILLEFAKKASGDKTLGEHCSEENWTKWSALAKQETTLDSKNEHHLNVLRFALLDFIADFANWDNSTVKEYLETSRALTQAAHEALGGEKGTRPLVVDPFAGGGSIPLEALRVGADVFASDLNPIPVLLNKVILEYIPKYGKRLADEVRKWGQWVKQEAEKELAEFYPKDEDGATPIAYLWARTIKCEGPGCGAEVPLIRSPWVVKKNNKGVALQLDPDTKQKRVEIRIIEKRRNVWVKVDDNNSIVPSPNDEGTVKRGAAICPCCGFTTNALSVRKQLKSVHGGANNSRLLFVVIKKADEQGRYYRLPTDFDLHTIKQASNALQAKKAHHKGTLSLVPDEPYPDETSSGALSSSVMYGHSNWSEIFTNRQLLTLSTLVDKIKMVYSQTTDLDDPELRNAIQILLAIVVDRQANTLTSLSRWHSSRENIEGVFSRQALPMVWDFGEANPLSNSTGCYDGALEWVFGSLQFRSTPQDITKVNNLHSESICR